MSLTQERLWTSWELHTLLVDYWHDVDTNWGRNAASYYTEDALFEGSQASYRGREQIAKFYRWREDRGARTAVHLVSNFRAELLGPAEALCTWYLQLYAADGVPVLPTHAPILVAMMTDRCQRLDEGWLCSHRKFESWFEGGIATTNPVLDASR
ncbi:MAG: nuclear transport factor 2 family protein [Rhizobiaceae bacterium]|nr:nuclear transport factor 2 family protein [Rhizobiaceae bacterium]